MAVITTTGLTKDYGSTRAVDGLTFAVEQGEVYALLGHNGAGKSTTVEILEGHRTRSGGDARVLGRDPGRGDRDWRDRIGIVLQTSGVESELSVREALTLYASAYSRRRVPGDAADRVGLTPQLDQRIATLSGGQRRRLDLALGIVGHPEVLFLDEPTTGFDPAARRSAWELVRELCSEGMTVLLTTHYLDEVERLADRVGVLRAGRLVAEGTPDALMTGAGGATVRFTVPDGVAPGELAVALPPDARVSGRRVEFTTQSPTAAVHAITSWALARGVDLAGLSVTRQSLEDVFLQLADAPPAPAESRR